jgi:hypothetical protein
MKIIFFSELCIKALANYNDSFVVAISEAVGLAPGFNESLGRIKRRRVHHRRIASGSHCLRPELQLLATPITGIETMPVWSDELHFQNISFILLSRDDYACQ